MKKVPKFLSKLFGSTKSLILNEKEYTQKYFDEIQSKFPEISFEIKDELVIKANFKTQDDVHLFLDNSFREYKSDPKDFDEIFERYSNSTASLFDTKAQIDKSRIVPIIKPATYFQDLKESMSEQIKDYKNPDLVWEKYNDDLIIVYAEDKETNFHYFSEDELEESGIGKTDLLKVSKENYLNLIEKIEVSGENGTYMILAGGDYEASLILNTNIWTKENFDVNGDFLIAVPNRDVLVVSGSNDDEGITRLKNIINDCYYEGNHSVSNKIFKWSGDKFKTINI